MSYELNGSDFTVDRVNKRAVRALLAGLGIGTMFWGLLLLAVIG